MVKAALVLVAFAWAAPGVAQENTEQVSAQGEPETPQLGADEQARALFDEARRAREEGRLADSLELLTRSLELLPRTSTAINLVRLHLAMGRPTLAQALLTTLSAGDFGLLGEAQQQRLGELRDETTQKIALLHVDVQSPGPVELRIDGVIPESTLTDSNFQLDPGAHVVRAESLQEHQEQHVDLRPGEQATLRFEFELEEEVEPPPPPRRLTWLWVTLGVLGAGAIATAAVLVATGDDPSPRTDPDGVFDVVMGLSFR